MWAGERDGLGLWGSSAGVVVEDDDHTVLGLTWDAFGWPALVYLQTILVGSLWVIEVLINQNQSNEVYLSCQHAELELVECTENPYFKCQRIFWGIN